MSPFALRFHYVPVQKVSVCEHYKGLVPATSSLVSCVTTSMLYKAVVTLMYVDERGDHSNKTYQVVAFYGTVCFC